MTVLMALIPGTPAEAKVTTAEAARLGTDLTPLGAMVPATNPAPSRRGRAE